MTNETVAYYLQIDSYISVIESIFNIYMKIEGEELLKFCYGLRYPIDRYNILTGHQLDTIRQGKPYHPYKCLAYVRDCILQSLYERTTYCNLYESNPLIKHGKSKCFIMYKKPASYEDILSTYIDNMWLEHKHVIFNALDGIIKQIRGFIPFNHNLIFNLDFETSSRIALIAEGNIWKFRYEEALREGGDSDGGT